MEIVFRNVFAEERKNEKNNTKHFDNLKEARNIKAANANAASSVTGKQHKTISFLSHPHWDFFFFLSFSMHSVPALMKVST